MSDQLTPEHLEQAAACIGAEVMAPAFFAKLASFGITPSNEKESEQLLELGIKLSAAAAQGLVDPGELTKQAGVAEVAEDENTFLKAAIDATDEVLQAAPVAPEVQQQAISQYVQNDDIVKTAALVLAAASAAGAEEN